MDETKKHEVEEKPMPRFPLWKKLCLGLLSLALVMNVMVLFIPFVELRIFLKDEPYTIFHTVQLLWQHDVYILATMVFGFSICFPFLKLLVLFSALLHKEINKKRESALRLVERFAKWSMLDVFLVILVLTVTHNQALVGSSPREGLFIFVMAITLSMIVGQVTCAKSLPPETKGKNSKRKTFIHLRLPAPVVGTFGMILFFLAITLPFLQISSWEFSANSYSLLSVLPELWKLSSPVSAIVVFLFIILAPFILQCAILLQSLGKETGAVWEKVVFFARKWSMLEVFALALVIFLVESSYLVHSVISWGGIFLGLLVIVYTITQSTTLRCKKLQL